MFWTQLRILLLGTVGLSVMCPLTAAMVDALNMLLVFIRLLGTYCYQSSGFHPGFQAPVVCSQNFYKLTDCMLMSHSFCIWHDINKVCSWILAYPPKKYILNNKLKV